MGIHIVELQKRKLRVLIDQIVACLLDVDPELLNGLPRTQQSQGVDCRLLAKLTLQQLRGELAARECDCRQLEMYANEVLQRLAFVRPDLVAHAAHLLDSLQVSQPIPDKLLPKPPVIWAKRVYK